MENRDSTLDRIFLITNFVVELPSAVFDQLSSVHKPQYALISMVMSLVIMIISMIDLARMGRKGRVKWMIRDKIPWFYSPYQNYKPLGSFADIVSLVCSVFQFVFAAIAYLFLSHHTDSPIRISVWPLVFAFGLLCSRLSRNDAHTISSLERIEIDLDDPAQDAIHGLQESEKVILAKKFDNGLPKMWKEAKEELPVMAKSITEVARLGEMNTLKRHGESVVKVKGLDIDAIQQHHQSH